MGKYCCFFHPKNDYSEKDLTDKCPICGREYGYILTQSPRSIANNGKEYTVVRPIGRGFYGATYLCEVQKRFKKEQILLKIIPVKLYQFFNKDFEEECNKHAQVSERTEHLVKIVDAFEAEVCFGTQVLQCHVAELQYIDGQELSEYIKDTRHIQPRIFVQLAIDLLKLWGELISKGEYHNDLHLGNLMVEQLDSSVRRVDSIYESIRLVAIDLNSVSDKSLSDYETQRLGDRQHVANHLSLLGKILRNQYKNIDDISDMDFRLIETLNKISKLLSISTTLSDIPEISELIEIIKDEFKNNISYSPWKKPLTLAKLNDTMNAQTLQTCHVPQLLVDPENKWIDEISILEPQLITGMRGCGKTMLLGALDVHARLVFPSNSPVEQTPYNSLKNDRYVGIMASCRELVDLDDMDKQGISKLLLLYSVQIIRAARHIRDVASDAVRTEYYLNLAENLKSIFGIDFSKKELQSEIIFERHLSDLSNRIVEFSENNKLRMSVISAFELLADSLKSASDILENKRVYFLLDDASTRYMSVDDISILFTRILFMSHKCAFKVTTELQSLYSFKSPGNIEMAQDIRDYQIFDLGADVFKRTRDPRTGKKFVGDIISKRLQACDMTSPALGSLDGVLGDCKLIELANYIIDHPSSQDRKGVYYGASALTALCVGDIGDIIFLYDSIISNNQKDTYPVSPEIQTQCFQQLCSRRMYNLERKDGTLREYVKAFSEASYKCLIDSKKAITREGKKSKRIRQYNSLYIRMTSGDIQKQQAYLRKLIDSGIFVFADGNGWPRAKSSDTDPITQIKLAFRKLFGVSNFIGLANADRFELSGQALEQWLEKPSKDILLRNLGNYSEEQEEGVVEQEKRTVEERAEQEEEILQQLEAIVGSGYQMSLFDICVPEKIKKNESGVKENLYKDILSRAEIVTQDEITTSKYFDIGIFGQGFEERSLESIKRVLKNNKFASIILVEYEEKGYADEIEKLASGKSNIIKIRFDEVGSILAIIQKADSVLLDVTGLYKPIIFEVVRRAVLMKKDISIVHTLAQDYYPLNSDIEKLIGSSKLDDATRFADLMRGLDTGDAGEYQHMKMLTGECYDPVRPTALLGFVSPKNQRIFSILDKKEYDLVNLIIPNGGTQRDVLARTAGNIAVTNYSAVRLQEIETTDPKDNLQELFRCYSELYVENNYNLEIALTGSKMQAVAAAALSAVCKVSQCWYVKPKKFDVKHFTKGVGETKWYYIDVSEKDF